MQLSQLGCNQRYQQLCRYTFPGTQQGVSTDFLLMVPSTLNYPVRIECTCCFSYLECHHFHRGISTCFLGTLAKLWKATIPWVIIFVVPCIMLNSEINPTKCNNCVYSSQWLYSTCFGWQFHPSSGVHMLYMASGREVYLCCNFVSIMVVLSL